MGKKLTNDAFILKARKIHGEKYNYSKIDYIDTHSKIEIICPQHGNFLQIPDNHLYRKNGCPACSQTLKITHLDFVKDSTKIHNGKYNYSLVKYQSSRHKIEIICPNHGLFQQTPAMHLLGQGCPNCSNIVSRPEVQWLDSLGVPKECRQKRVLIGETYIKTDAYDPAINTIYEFWGDYWHGNPAIYSSKQLNNSTKKTFGELYRITQSKRNLILENGYNLIDIWEHDFKLNRK
jgi:hypothetical protein